MFGIGSSQTKHFLLFSFICTNFLAKVFFLLTFASPVCILELAQDLEQNLQGFAFVSVSTREAHMKEIIKNVADKAWRSIRAVYDWIINRKSNQKLPGPPLQQAGPQGQDNTQLPPFTGGPEEASLLWNMPPVGSLKQRQITRAKPDLQRTLLGDAIDVPDRVGLGAELHIIEDAQRSRSP